VRADKKGKAPHPAIARRSGGPSSCAVCEPFGSPHPQALAHDSLRVDTPTAVDVPEPRYARQGDVTHEQVMHVSRRHEAAVDRDQRAATCPGRPLNSPLREGGRHAIQKEE
jgi:hypothetical protein